MTRLTRETVYEKLMYLVEHGMQDRNLLRTTLRHAECFVKVQIRDIGAKITKYTS